MREVQLFPVSFSSKLIIILAFSLNSFFNASLFWFAFSLLSLPEVSTHEVISSLLSKNSISWQENPKLVFLHFKKQTFFFCE